MKIRILAVCAVASLLLANLSTVAQENTAAADELRQLMTKVSAKLKELRPAAAPGAQRKVVKITEADLSAELKQFDALLAKHKEEKTDDVAQILYMKYMVYAQVIGDREKGT